MAATVALFASACEPSPAPQLPLGHVVGEVDTGTLPQIGCERADERIQLTTSARLDPECTYTAGIDVTGSHVTLDCRGATIDPGDGRSGVGIHAHSPASTPLVDVEIRNCVTRGFTNGIRVSRDGFKSLAPGHEYDVGTADIRLVNNDVGASNGSGIFVNGYVSDVTIDRQRVHDAGGPGIYLEAGSRGNTVRGSTIVDNGYADTTPPGPTMVLGGTTFEYLHTGREGIAIDGSRDNLIESNVIARNALAGITLYKNCGEYATEKPTEWWTRPYGASDNTITGNLVADEPTGVWVGSRMGQNTEFFDCSDTPYHTGPLLSVTLDSAPDNTVADNVIASTVHGVRVEDDGTTVTHNRFIGDAADPTFPAAEAILVGTKWRTTILGSPVIDTHLVDNSFDELLGVEHPATWIYAPVDGLPAGVAPPIDAFLMVASIRVVG